MTVSFLKELKVQPSYEQVLELFVNELVEQINFCNGGYTEEFSVNPTEKSIYEKYASDAGMSMGEFMSHICNVNKRKLQMVKKGLCKRAVMMKSCSALSDYLSSQRDHSVIIHFENGKYYEVSDKHTSVMSYTGISVDGMRGTRLYSLQETLNFIEKYKVVFHDTQRVYDFWEKHPNGIIKID